MTETRRRPEDGDGQEKRSDSLTTPPNLGLSDRRLPHRPRTPRKKTNRRSVVEVDRIRFEAVHVEV